MGQVLWICDNGTWLQGTLRSADHSNGKQSVKEGIQNVFPEASAGLESVSYPFYAREEAGLALVRTHPKQRNFSNSRIVCHLEAKARYRCVFTVWKVGSWPEMVYFGSRSSSSFAATWHAVPDAASSSEMQNPKTV